MIGLVRYGFLGYSRDEHRRCRSLALDGRRGRRSSRSTTACSRRATACASDAARDRPGHDRHDLPRLRPARASWSAAPTASSPSTSRSRAGSSTTRPRSGTSRAPSPARRSTTPACEPGELEAVGITNQRETVVCWDPSTGEPLHRALVWQDRRTAGALRRAARGRARAGDRARAHRARARPVLLGDEDRVAAAQRRRARASGRANGRAVFGTIDAWLIFKLTGELRDRPHERLAHAALRHLDAGAGTPSCCELFGVPRAGAARGPAELRRVRGARGRTSSTATTCPSPASPATSRRRCSGRRCLDPGLGKNTYGTGSFVLLNAGTSVPPAADGLLVDGRLAIGAPDRPTRSRRRSSSPAPPCSGCATASGSSSAPPRPRRSPRRWTPTTASTSSPR